MTHKWPGCRGRLAEMADGMMVCRSCFAVTAAPKPVAVVTRDEVGDPNSPSWRLMAAYISRTRTARLEHAQWCMEHLEAFDADQQVTIRGIIDGVGDPILQKCMEHGIDPE